MNDSKEIIKNLALKSFSLVGIASTQSSDRLIQYKEWINQGMNGDMNYLARHLPFKENPNTLMPDCKSWICLAKYYDTQEELSINQPKDKGWIARYARQSDYHETLQIEMDGLIKQFKKHFPNNNFQAYVDSGPVLERDLARQAGLGWVGKNTCVINPKLGSFIFLCEILTDLELEPDKPTNDHCGTCRKCIDVCPTQAINEDRTLDARKCISYWTIESKTQSPDDLKTKFGNNFFGCDICQDVCPWNSHSRKTNPLPAAQDSGLVDLDEFLNLSDEQIKKWSQTKALSRAKPSKLRENAVICLKNRDLKQEK